MAMIPTVEHVREAINTQLDNATIEGLISDAVTLVKHRIGHLSFGDDVLMSIMKYVSAHNVALRDPSSRAIEEQLGEAKIRYASIGGSSGQNRTTGLMSTYWGQMAASYDTSGTLGNMTGPECAFHSLDVPVTSI